MAQEKHRPPLPKAAKKGEAGQAKNKKVEANLTHEMGAKETGQVSQSVNLSKRGMDNKTPPQSSLGVGQPGGPNIKTGGSPKSRAPQPTKKQPPRERAALDKGDRSKPVSLRQRVEQEPYPTRTNSAPQTQAEDDDGQMDRRRAAPARRRSSFRYRQVESLREPLARFSFWLCTALGHRG